MMSKYDVMASEMRYIICKKCYIIRRCIYFTIQIS